MFVLYENVPLDRKWCYYRRDATEFRGNITFETGCRLNTFCGITVITQMLQ